ncbi:MAG: hypothetical protein CMI54_05980 [Parcubacteria group bacterium]|nr:hypothetical protein [Parcubacteria group bacterium]|tara:strand:+ start:26709 stop:26906 length:198 start_codon:yes stop_codon:yes gene_type:complete
MKKLITLTVVTLLLVASGCTSTVTLGPQANESDVVGAAVGQRGASVTIPFVKGEVKTIETKGKKK